MDWYKATAFIYLFFEFINFRKFKKHLFSNQSASLVFHTFENSRNLIERLRALQDRYPSISANGDGLLQKYAMKKGYKLVEYAHVFSKNALNSAKVEKEDVLLMVENNFGREVSDLIKRDWENLEERNELSYKHNNYMFSKGELMCFYRPLALDFGVYIFQRLFHFLLLAFSFIHHKVPAGDYVQSFYYKRHPTEKKCLFFVHGVGMGPCIYFHFILYLSRYFSIIVYEIYSSNLQDSLIKDNVLNRSIIFCQYLDMIRQTNVVLVGHSFGSMVVSSLYNNMMYIGYGSRITSMIIIDPVCFYHNSVRATNMMNCDYTTFRQYFKNQNFAWMPMFSLFFFIFFIRNVRNQYLCKRILNCNTFLYMCPKISTLCFIGKKDSIIDADSMVEHVRKAFPEVKLVLGESDAHGTFLCNPESFFRVATRIIRFVQEEDDP